ncbi:MAG: hypothetical protein JSU87_06710 [Gemmatimonadota bacterium]|nr:MAG: hypothetical protein JSU87_06710 [Gemmatimonadota bacterium]
MLANNIGEVVERLDEIIGWSRENRSRLGYFAALYRKVTIEVRQGIADGFFEDGRRMERLDVAFANRYLEAFYQLRRGDAPTSSWRVAFSAAGDWWPIVLQHLLLGMNAHINLDLGIAAAAVSPGDEIRSLESDFKRINAILARLVDDVQGELAEIWPALRLLDRVAGRADDAIVNFSMEKARQYAWKTAVRLAPLGPAAQVDLIRELDREVAAIGRVVRAPGVILGFVTKIIRLRERGSVESIIDILR